MSVKISKIFTRPDASIPWHYEVFPGDAFISQFNDVHLTNCMLKERNIIDPLNIEFKLEWASDEAYQAYLDDPILKEFWKARDEYNQVVGIVAQDSVIERTT